MSIEIIQPKVTAIVLDQSTTIDVGLGKFVPVNFVDPILFTYNGLICFFFAQENTENFWVLAVNPYTNKFCWYSNRTNFNGIQSGDYTTNLFVSSNSVIISQNPNFNINYSFQLPNVFTPSGYIVIPSKNIVYPSCPCGGAGTPHNTWYSYSQQLMIKEYIQAFPEAYNLWANVIKYNPIGYSVITAGYCGNFPNGVDPIIDRSSLDSIYSPVSPGYSFADFYFDVNDYYMAHAIQYTGMPSIYSGFYRMSVEPGALNCAGTGTAPKMTLAPFAILDQKSSIFKGTYYLYANADGRQRQAICDVKNVIAFSSYSAMDLFNGYDFLELQQTAFGSLAFKAGAFVNNKVFSFGSSWNGTGLPYAATLIIGSSSRAIPSMQPPPVIQSAQATPLLNWHRPISTRGLFRT